MKFAREKVWDLWDEAWDLMMAHWKEIAHYKDILLDPDMEMYNTVEENGGLRVYTARAEHEKLVGYAVFFVRKNPHYVSSLQASQDILFIHENYRRGWIGYKFLKWMDEQLRAEGVQAVYHHIKAQHNFGPILERIGYEQIDVIYGRRLDHGSNSGDSHRSSSCGRGSSEEISPETAGHYAYSDS